MEMTNEEILRSYRQAKFPEEQIKVLADLNVCSRARIVQILAEGGVDPKVLPKLTEKDTREPKKQKQKKPKKPEPDLSAVLEKEIERKLAARVKAYGGLCLKWVCPGWSGVPDRIILLPGARVSFVETKRPKGGLLSKLQLRWGRILKGLGFDVRVIWNQDDLDDFEKKVLQKGE